MITQKLANIKDTIEECYSSSLEVLKKSIINYDIPYRTIIFDPSLEKWKAQQVPMFIFVFVYEMRPYNHIMANHIRMPPIMETNQLHSHGSKWLSHTIVSRTMIV